MNKPTDLLSRFLGHGKMELLPRIPPGMDNLYKLIDDKPAVPFRSPRAIKISFDIEQGGLTNQPGVVRIVGNPRESPFYRKYIEKKAAQIFLATEAHSMRGSTDHWSNADKKEMGQKSITPEEMDANIQEMARKLGIRAKSRSFPFMIPPGISSGISSGPHPLHHLKLPKGYMSHILDFTLLESKIINSILPTQMRGLGEAGLSAAKAGTELKKAFGKLKALHSSNRLPKKAWPTLMELYGGNSDPTEPKFKKEPNRGPAYAKSQAQIWANKYSHKKRGKL